LPDGTTLYFSLRPSRLAGEPNFGPVVGQLGGQWQQTVGAVSAGLGLKPEVIRRLTWAAADLAAWPEQSVVVIELEQGHGAESLGALGEAVDLALVGAACRRLPEGVWKHPFAVLDRQTIVTGQMDLLRQLAGRKEVRLESATIERLLPLAASDAELTVLVDLAAARKADWRLPTALLDVWPPGKQPWHVVWETSEGLGCRLLGSDRFRSELVLVCEGETAAEQVQTAVDELIPAAKNWLSAEVGAVSGRLKAGQMTATMAASYQSLLKDGVAAADAAQWKVVDGSVWVWVDWDRRPSAIAAAAIESREAIRAAWLAAARAADEAQHRRLLAGLPASQQAEGLSAGGEGPRAGGQGPGVATSGAADPRGTSGQGPEPKAPPEEVVPAKPQAPPPPVAVDVAARLADAVPEIQLRGVPLAEAVDLLAGLSTVPISFDPEAMQQLGVTLHDPVTIELSGATVGQILQKVVSSRGLAAVVEEGQMLVTSPPDRREKLWPRRYTVSDLAGDDPTAVAELAAVIGKLVAPDSWRQSGGRGTIEPDGGALAVVQTGVVHDEILTFCEKLRNARGKPLRSRQSPERFGLETRLDRAQATLNRPVTANFHEPTPLIEVLGYLGKLAETDILVDRLALSAAGVSDRTDARVTVEKQPLAEALPALLNPLGLEYRVIDAKTLQVTTRKAVAARLELEFYPVNKLLANGRTGPALVEQIKGRLAGSTWSDAGGPGVLYFDQPSSCLIVLQSQPVQGELARLLAELRN
jgi:hypothetical protein